MTAEQFIKNNYGPKYVSTTYYGQGSQANFWSEVEMYEEYSAPPIIPLGPSMSFIKKGTERAGTRTGEIVSDTYEDSIYYCHNCYWREYDAVKKVSVISSFPDKINYSAIYNFREGDVFSIQNERQIRLKDIMHISRERLYGVEEVGREKEGVLYLDPQDLLHMLISYNAPAKSGL